MAENQNDDSHGASRSERDKYLPVHNFYRVTTDFESLDAGAMAAGNIVAEAVGAASHDSAVKLPGPERRSSVCACIICCIDIPIDIEKCDVDTCDPHGESPSNRQPAKGYGFEIVVHRV